MNPKVKLTLYIVTTLGTLVFGLLFAQAWRRAYAGVVPPSGARLPSATTNATPGTPTAGEPVASELTPEQEVVPAANKAVVGGRGFGRVLFWGFLALAALLGLGSLAGYDIAHFAGQRATLSLFDDEGDPISESTYEQVEKAYGEGEYLEAIRLLREFLKENPAAVHAQIRIAEIYEKDLNNPLAAALEYEEVLLRSFEPERKGWTAIHLVNLYNRLDKPDQAVAWMRRIVAEFPGTPAAAKARERLEAAGIELPETPPPDSGTGTGGGEAPSGLPPGFRPRA